MLSNVVKRLLQSILGKFIDFGDTLEIDFKTKSIVLLDLTLKIPNGRGSLKKLHLNTSQVFSTKKLLKITISGMDITLFRPNSFEGTAQDEVDLPSWTEGWTSGFLMALQVELVETNITYVDSEFGGNGDKFVLFMDECKLLHVDQHWTPIEEWHVEEEVGRLEYRKILAISGIAAHMGSDNRMHVALANVGMNCKVCCT